ncbi:MAG: hypothetical protein COA43_07425 [Robiginitomaculum sp.]|nr:MAG: hypothetical protein COA43_07425 [Robiginitomaculum sp.]
MKNTIYKILRETEWKNFQSENIFTGSVHDKRDGFIHMSANTQLMGTLDKHYVDIKTIILAQFDAKLLQGVKWEISRGGEKFPHIYGTLTASALKQYWTLEAGENSRFTLPKNI